MDSKRYWVAWNMVGGIGARRFGALIDRFGSAEAAWNASYDRVAQVAGITEAILQSWRSLRARADIDAVIRRLERDRVAIITLEDPGYPTNLKPLSDAPPVLYVRGQLLESDASAIAIVGTRTPTPLGITTAERFAGELASEGITVVSGLARGIDTAAHEGALAAGGRTIGILGSGIDMIYPKENMALAEQMARSGAVISEFCPGTEPLPGHFPARNRVISGLSLGVLVVEAACDSGSLITAGHAAEQGREVFAIPGVVGGELSGGPNRLIKQGAKLVEDIGDILEELKLPRLSRKAVRMDTPELMDADEKAVFAHIRFDPKHLDEIARLAGQDVSRVAGVLLGLELRGIVRQLPGKLFCRVR